MKRYDRKQRTPGAVREEHGTEHTQRPAPGKVTRTSKLPPRREPAVQRKAAVRARDAAAPQQRSSWDFTMDPWMDAAHRGVTALAERGQDIAQAAGSVHANGAQDMPEVPALASGTALQRRANGDALPSDSLAVAAVGAQGQGASLPYQDRIQASFGKHEITGVRAHRGEAAAAASEALSARAYAFGRDIVFGSSPDLHTAAHEAAHVVQQRAGVHLAGGVGAAGDVYERHADQVADAVVRGESAEALLDQHAGGGAQTRAVQADGGRVARRRRRRSRRDRDEEGQPRDVRRAMRLDRHRAGREEEQDVYLGTDVGVVDADGAPVHRHVGGGDSSERTALGWGDSIRGGTTRAREEREGRAVFVDRIDEEARTLTERTTRQGTQVQELDSVAMAADLRGQLERALRDERTLARREGREQDATHRADAEALERDIARLREVQPDDDPGVVHEIAGRHGMLVAPQYRVSSQDMTTEARGVDSEGTSGDQVRVHRRRTIERASEEGSQTSVRSDHGAIDPGAGSVTVGRSEEDSTSRGNQRTRRRRDGSVQVTVAEGVRGTIRSERTDMATNAAGTEEERAQVREHRGGVVAGDDGWGVTRGHTRRDTERRGDDEDTVERRRDVTIRESGVSGSVATDRDVRRGAVTYGTRTSADGSFTIEIEAQNTETPRTYRMVFTIHADVTGRLSADRASETGRGAAGRGAAGRGFRGGVYVRGEASGDLVFRRTLSAEQAEQYWSEAQRAGRRGGTATSSLPELQRLARIQAGLENTDQLANAGALVGSSGATRDMAEGDEMELTLRASAGFGGNPGRRGRRYDVGVQGEHMDEWTRRVLVRRIGSQDRARVRITVTYEHDERWHLQSEASIGRGPTVGVRQGGNSGDGESVRFTLNPGAPSFDEQYRTIVGTTERAELLALSRDPAYQSALDYTEHTEEEGAEGHGEMRRGVGIRGRYNNHCDERVRQGRDGSLSGEVNCSRDTSLQIRAGDMAVAQAGIGGSSHAVVERDGQMDVALQESEHSSNPVRTAQAAGDAWGSADGEERLRQALSASPGERLRQLLETEYTRLRGFHLDAGDIETLVARAADQRRWNGCAPGSLVRDDWRRLGALLRNPRVRPNEARVDGAVARQLAIARHLARFYQTQGERAREPMHNALRNWGVVGIAGIGRVSDAEQVGSEFEWPPALQSQQRLYERIRAEVRDLERAMAGEATQGDTGESSANARYERALHLHDQLTAIHTAVAGSSDFESEGARASMLRHIGDHLARLRRLRISEREQRRAPDAEPDARAGRVELELARAQVDTILRRLRVFKAREQAQLSRANRLSYSYSDRLEAIAICTQLHAMAEVWYLEVQDLRRAYQTLGTRPNAWQVSQQGGTRSRTLEPEIGWLILIYERCHEGNSIDDGRTQTAQWRREFRAY